MRVQPILATVNVGWFAGRVCKNHNKWH